MDNHIAVSLNLVGIRKFRKTPVISAKSACVGTRVRSAKSAKTFRAPSGRNDDDRTSPAPRSAGDAAMMESSTVSTASRALPSDLGSMPSIRRRKFLTRFVNISHAENLPPSGLIRDMEMRKSGFVSPSARNSRTLRNPLNPGSTRAPTSRISVVSCRVSGCDGLRSVASVAACETSCRRVIASSPEASFSNILPPYCSYTSAAASRPDARISARSAGVACGM